MASSVIDPGDTAKPNNLIASYRHVYSKMTAKGCKKQHVTVFLEDTVLKAEAGHLESSKRNGKLQQNHAISYSRLRGKYVNQSWNLRLKGKYPRNKNG